MFFFLQIVVAKLWLIFLWMFCLVTMIDFLGLRVLLKCGGPLLINLLVLCVFFQIVVAKLWFIFWWMFS